MLLPLRQALGTPTDRAEELPAPRTARRISNLFGEPRQQPWASERRFEFKRIPRPIELL